MSALDILWAGSFSFGSLQISCVHVKSLDTKMGRQRFSDTLSTDCVFSLDAMPSESRLLLLLLPPAMLRGI